MSSVFSRFQKQTDDSDQSISEEESPNIGSCVQKKGGNGNGNGMHVLSQLDLLKEPLELATGSGAITSPPLTQNSCSHEDEIEFPAFDRSDDLDQLPDGASNCVSDHGINWFSYATHVNITDEEIISDDDDRAGYPASLSISYDGEVALTGARRKPPGMIYSSDKPGCSSSYRKVDEQDKDYKGGQVKHKNSLLSTLRYTTEDSPLNFKGKSYSSKLFDAQPANRSNSATRNKSNKSTADLLEVNDGNLKQSLGHELQNDAIVYQHSVTESFDGFQEISGFPLSNLNKHSRTKGRNRSLAHKRSKTSSCHRKMDNNNETESSDIGQSSGDEDDPQNLKSSKPGKTMADQLQEIFGVISASDLLNKTSSRQSGGLHEKLQCIMQNEKDIETIFLRTLPVNAASAGENQYMDVKILSRCLEAKVTVCRCALTGNKESFETVNDYGMGNFGRALTILFSTKICTDVELEMGNLIRIHYPWKEVQLKGNDEVILLSTYFSLICT